MPSKPTARHRLHMLGRAPLLMCWVLLQQCHVDPGKNQRSKGEQPAAPVVATQLTENVLQVEHRYLGEVWANAEASLSVAEAGRVRKVHVVDGDLVKKGQLLLELDDRLARAELNQALAERQQVGVERDHAVREAERFRQLQAEQVTSALESEREAAQALSLEARSAGVSATVQAQSERVQRHRITAPFAGVVARRHVDPGDWLIPGQTALELVTDDRVEVLVRVPVELLDRLSAVQGIELSKEGQRIAARLSGAVNALERSTRTALMRLDSDQRPAWLRAGATVDVLFRLQKEGTAVLPRDALVQGVAATRVIKIVDKKATPTDVKVVASNRESVLVHSPELRLGDRVVVRGNERLRPGQRLQVSVGNGAKVPQRDGSAQKAGP